MQSRNAFGHPQEIPIIQVKKESAMLYLCIANNQKKKETTSSTKKKNLLTQPAHINI